MQNHNFNASIKASLLGIALITNANADALLNAANQAGTSVYSASNFEFCPADTLNSLKTLNYYPASEYNKVFGSHTIQEIGNGNKRFTAIDGEVSECWPGDPKDAIKQYGDGTYLYNEWYVDDISQYEKYYQEKGETLPDELRHDIEALRSPLKGTKTCMPGDVCQSNLKALRSYYNNMMKEAISLQDNGLALTRSPSSRQEGAMIRNKGKYMRKFFMRVAEKLSNGLAHTSNKYIEKHVDNIFPSTVKVSEATADEINNGKCVKGLLKRYLAKNGAKSALCIGNDADGMHIEDYLLKHTETKDWVPDTFVENMKYRLGKMKSGAEDMAEWVYGLFNQLINACLGWL